MIRKFRYGAPFNTEALTEEIETADGAFPYGRSAWRVALILPM